MLKILVGRPTLRHGKQLAAVSNISAGSPFVDWSVPVSVVPFPAVEYFSIARNYSCVAQHFLDNHRRWRHLKHKTGVGVYFRKSKAMLARRMDDTMHFTIKDNANVEAPTRIRSARMRKYLFQIRFVHRSMWLRNTSNFSFGFLVLHETEIIFFFGRPDAMVLVGFAITAV